MSKVKKRKILFLDGNCSGRCFIDDGDGNVRFSQIYSLSSFSDSWACIISNNDQKAQDNFYSYFEEVKDEQG